MDKTDRNLLSRRDHSGAFLGGLRYFSFKKKDGEAEERGRKTENKTGSRNDYITLDTVLVGAISRGLTATEIRSMELVQVLDYCEEWNRMHEPEEPEKKRETNEERRMMSQAEINAFLG